MRCRNCDLLETGPWEEYEPGREPAELVIVCRRCGHCHYCCTCGGLSGVEVVRRLVEYERFLYRRRLAATPSGT